MEWLEVAAPSMETAKEMALERLGVHESDAELKIVNEGKIGLFGRVKEEARIRARVLPTSRHPKNKAGGDLRQSKPSNTRHSSKRRGRVQGRRSQAASARSRSRKRSNNSSTRERSSRGSRSSASSARSRAANTQNGKKTVHQRKTLSLTEQADLAESFVKGVADVMDISLNFKRHDLEGGVMHIEGFGEDIGILVGHQGTTARAIDGLVRTVLQRSGGTIRQGKIRIDVGGLRVRRHEALVDFTKRAVSDVLESGEGARLDPMNRLDRKVVHDAVSEIEGVESCSEGNDPTRYVVITASAAAT